jgi:hypothetical protein
MSTKVPHYAAALSGKACGLVVGGRRAKLASLLGDGGFERVRGICGPTRGVPLGWFV